MYAVPGQKRIQALRKILPWKPFRTLFLPLCTAPQAEHFLRHLPALVEDPSSPWYAYLTTVYRKPPSLPFNLSNLNFFYHRPAQAIAIDAWHGEGVLLIEEAIDDEVGELDLVRHILK